MAIKFEQISELKYFNLRKEDLLNRFIPTLNIYDNEWKVYFITEKDLLLLKEVIDIVDGFYISKNLVKENDIKLDFFNFMLKRNNFKENLQQISHIYDDLYNLLASADKISFFSEIYKYKDHLKLCKYASIELESIFQNSRAIFENLQKIQNNLMKNTISANKDNLFTINKVLFDENLTVNQYMEKYKIPELLAKFYFNFQYFFFFILNMRNDIFHSRKSFRLLLGNEGFSIPLNEYNLEELQFWNETNTLKNNLGSVKTLIGYIIINTINALEEYSRTIDMTIKLPDDILPNYNIYIRNDFNNILKKLHTFKDENAWNI